MASALTAMVLWQAWAVAAHQNGYFGKTVFEILLFTVPLLFLFFIVTREGQLFYDARWGLLRMGLTSVAIVAWTCAFSYNYLNII